MIHKVTENKGVRWGAILLALIGLGAEYLRLRNNTSEAKENSEIIVTVLQEQITSMDTKLWDMNAQLGEIRGRLGVATAVPSMGSDTTAAPPPAMLPSLPPALWLERQRKE